MNVWDDPDFQRHAPDPGPMPDWIPYRPPGYPITNPHHNPYVRVDPISGECARDVWEDLGRPTDERVLQRALDELKAR